MRKLILAAGAAAIALSAPLLANPDKGKGGGGPKAAKVERGGDARADKGAQRADKGAQRVEASRSPERAFEKSARGPETRGSDKRPDRVDRRAAQADKADRIRPDKRDEDRVALRDRDDDGRFFARNDRARDGRGLDNGCPPGLAAKNNNCLPPGQAKKLVGAVLPAAFGANMLSGPFSQWYQDNDQYYYRNDGANIYRVSRNGGLVDALIPYGAQDYSYFPVGMNYPGEYDFYNVPDQYRSFYADGSDYEYRYGNNAIYQLNPQTNAIQSIVALLAGDLSVGQPMPSNYSMYNVPLAYRDRYYDSPDAMYRYNDGYIYRADPKTQLITAVIDALV